MQVDLFNYLIEELVERAVVAAHENATGGVEGLERVDGHVVAGYRVERLRREAHLVALGAVALGEAYEVDGQEDHLAGGGHAQAVLDAVVECARLGHEQLHGQYVLAQVVVETNVASLHFLKKQTTNVLASFSLDVD